MEPVTGEITAAAGQRATRAEHVRFCKERARELLRAGDLVGAVTSMLSDLGKHEETANMSLMAGMLGMAELINPTECGVSRFIEGFAE